MIYLSAQPDSTYFIWQLEIQFRNFRSLGISKKQIHAVIGYNPECGLKREFKSFVDRNKSFANFFFYPDSRENPKYISSIRPNILKQHFDAHPYLENEVLFYHDSDVVFSRIPQIKDFEKEICYVSDTHSYLGIDYIIQAGSEYLLEKMLSIVGLPKSKLREEDRNSGGAQYILKGLSSFFWGKVERDAEALYILMAEYNHQLWKMKYPTAKEFRSRERGIQAWCADMWALLWNLWYFNRKVKIHPELQFSWPSSPIEDWSKRAIHHYSGNTKEGRKFFKKNEYVNHMPWYDSSLNSIPNTNCSFEIVKLIKARKKELDLQRPNFPRDIIIIWTGCITRHELQTYEVLKAYITKALNVKVLLYTAAAHAETHEDIIATADILVTLQNITPNNLLWLPIDRLIDAKTIVALLLNKRNKQNQVYRLLTDPVYKIDRLFLEAFSKVLDTNLLYRNLGKFYKDRHPSRKQIILTNGDLKHHELSTLLAFFSDEPKNHQAHIIRSTNKVVAFNLN